MIAGWFLARTVIPKSPFPAAFLRITVGCAIVISLAIIGALVGSLVSPHRTGDHPVWTGFCNSLGVTDVSRFVHVAYIHYGSYLGGFLGLITSVVVLRRWESARSADGQADSPTGDN